MHEVAINCCDLSIDEATWACPGSDSMRKGWSMLCRVSMIRQALYYLLHCDGGLIPCFPHRVDAYSYNESA